MATNRWLPKAQKTAQVNTITLTAYDAATTYNVAINGKTVSQIGTGGTTTTTAAALVALLQASAEPEFQEITWTQLANVITATMSTNRAGTPFTQTSSVTGGAGTISNATPTANVSPNDVNNTANWSLAALPGNGDDVIVDTGDAANSMWWNCDALAAVTLNSFTRRKSFTGSIGLQEYNTLGGTPYLEYRKTELQFGLQGAFNATIEQPSSDQPAQIKLNTGTTQTTLTVLGNGASLLGSEALWWRGTHASNVVNNEGGSVAVAPVNANAATIATLNAENGTARLGSGLTGPTTINNRNSTIEVNATFTTLNQTGSQATLTAKGTAAATTLNIDDSSSVVWQSSGTITTANIGTSATLDFSQDNRTRTVTNKVQLFKGATYNDPAATTFAAGLSFLPNRCQLSDCTVAVGVNRTFTVT